MNYPYQRDYWTRNRMGLLALLAVLGIFGGTPPQGVPDLLGQAVGVVLFTVVLVGLYHGLREVKDRAFGQSESGVE